MLNTFKEAVSIDEFAVILLEYWDTNEPDSLSENDLFELKKILLEKNFISLAKNLSPLENYAFKRFNLSGIILNELDPKKIIFQKLKFAIWHSRLTKKVYNFIAKAGSDDLKSKLNLLKNSLKSLNIANKSVNKREIAKRFTILSDLASQLGYYMFSLLAVKTSLKNDPEFLDATIFLGKAYLELGTEFSQRQNQNRSKDHGCGTYQYNFTKSKEVFQNSLSNLSPEKKQKISDLIISIDAILFDIEEQKKQGKHTIVHVVVEDFIKDKLEKVEEIVTKSYDDDDFKFPQNIKEITPIIVTVEDKEKEEKEDVIGIAPKKRAKEYEAIKPGKLFNIYSNQSGFKQTKKKGRISSDKVGYKLKLEDVLKNINSEVKDDKE